jgi:AraC-like DNA-binding protein
MRDPMHGRELGRTSLGEARLGLVRHRAGQETPRHGHERACLHVVLRGLYVEHSRDGTVVACPGDVVFKGPEVEHWNHFGTSGAESLRFELVDVPPEPTSPDAAELTRALGMRRSLSAPARPTSSRTGVAPEAALLVRLRRDFRERLRLGDLATELGVDRSHLTRQFSRAFGCSPQTYVAFRRAAWAARELARGSGTLASIAAAAGFADQSHCTRTFRRALGTTPLRWSRETRW